MNICQENKNHFTVVEVSVTSWVEALSDVGYKSNGQSILRKTQRFIRNSTVAYFTYQELVNKTSHFTNGEGFAFSGKEGLCMCTSHLAQATKYIRLCHCSSHSCRMLTCSNEAIGSTALYYRFGCWSSLVVNSLLAYCQRGCLLPLTWSQERFFLHQGHSIQDLKPI